MNEGAGMKFVIKNQKQRKEEGFYFKITWMSGDADAYEYDTYGPFKESDFEALERVVDFMDRFIHFDHNSKCDRSYKVLEDWRTFVDYWDPSGDYSNQNKIAIEWQNDVTCEGRPADLNSYEMFYIDKDNFEFDVEVEK